MNETNGILLEMGDTGDNVKILQEKLKILGFYHAMITGSFGNSTFVGVKAFQNANNLEETGVVTADLWRLLFMQTENEENLLRLTLPLSIGDEGEDVEELQTKLKALLYYTSEVNGIFDLETENAVKRFQLLNDLTTSGVVNNQTWNRINSLYGNLAPCAGGSSSDDNNDNNYITYTVKRDDTLYSIARQYDTTVDEIKRLNNLVSNTLQIGQVLKIPTESTTTDYIDYTVQRNDTLYSIARRYDTTVDEIKKLNNLVSNTLQIGQVLRIPVGENQSTNYINYVVQRNDTLYSIARQYDTTVDEIKRINNLVSNTLQIGQVLKIPTESTTTDYIEYTVRRNDTLYSIAIKYNTSVDAIQNLNNLTSNVLQIGQILKIPV